MSASQLDREMFLAARLQQHGAGVFTGCTDTDTRRERFRAAILERGLEAVIVGRGKDGKPENYSQLFERIYGTALAATTSKARAARETSTT